MHEPALRAAAFGSDPLPDPAVVRGPGSPRERLLAAIVLGAQGRYAAAATLLDALWRGSDPVTASLAASTLASHRRQLGGHRQARALDGEALAKAASLDTEQDPDGLDAAGARADALLGLAADNLALGRLTAARRLAAQAAEEDAGWRGRVRGGWVGAEIALAAGQGADAVPHAERALETALARSARRHVVKSRIVLAVALRAAGAPDHRNISDDLVGNAMAAAEECELLSLSWPAALVAADLRPGHAEEYRFRVAQVLHAVLRSADPCGRRVAGESPWVPVPGG
ncbi:hypothetical protein AMES_0764 [Amycolatopsis mediterranei S699]|uniref:Uncharacterized protein n=2 Tax=Amycolatopsis mediterranei TaxID=33910 RepID=A0A0H3CZ75_AMYMU|nr:hypothetical protein [Amycolatopsis mediterranei]ADJ42586.1 conserved hypothetical protein [Amycolatopsis mediterranei U32]AEK39273.1 hypothetical protein RAM_03905 [Amycolatopsis mediterranei S699]AFO74300.1 hypothetical protein AMES_0764 [Amycolatopsis mediterranei S699]AGT81429.1 hypothetical protein B737_0765 [Amycolatopsis mediterranei RB]KDO10114.1 hypothetical protein DV26_15660 [Amycolatopsis mediterranei]